MDSLLNGLSHSVKADKNIVKVCTFFFLMLYHKRVYTSLTSGIQMSDFPLRIINRGFLPPNKFQKRLKEKSHQ